MSRAYKLLTILLGLAIALVVAGVLIGYIWFQQQREPFTQKALERDLALQDDSVIPTRPQELKSVSAEAPQPNPQRNLYFGELHLHTDQSFDSVLFGNRLTIEDAYRFARGEPLMSQGLEQMELTRPLDFVAVTDHAEGFGSQPACSRR